MPGISPELLRFFRDSVPFNKHLGIQIVDVREGHVRFELPFRPELVGDSLRPALHGGVLSALMDAAGGFAVWTKVSPEDRVSTIDMRIDYLAPARPETLVCEADVVRIGNRIGVTDMRCLQPSTGDPIVATGKGVYNVRRKDET